MTLWCFLTFLAIKRQVLCGRSAGPSADTQRGIVFSRGCTSMEGWKGSWWGGHVGHHVVNPCRDVIGISPEVPTRVAAGLLLAQVGYNGAFKPPVRPGDTAVVIGDGLVGQYAAQALRHRGALVILSGLSAFRLDLAAQCSAAEVFDNSVGDFKGFIAERFPEGVDIVVDTASTHQTVMDAITMCKSSGHLVLNGFYPYPEASRLDWHWLRRKELTLYFPDSRKDERLKSTLELVRKGKIHIEELITDTPSIEDASEVYSRLLSGDDDYLGIVLGWSCSESAPFIG